MAEEVVRSRHYIWTMLVLLAAATGLFAFQKDDDATYVSYTIDPKAQTLQFFWKDDKGKIIGNAAGLLRYLRPQNRRLVFAVNGGMYHKDQTPVGLYIENGKELAHINRDTGHGNFYMKPNGIFYITNAKKAGISTTQNFSNKDIKYATQSGPMLVVDGAIHPTFKRDSKYLNIRNGVGILPEGRVLFAMSKGEVNFYEFAKYFKDKGCRNALYLDGFVSRTYLPSKRWTQMDGGFGVMIAETAPDK